MKFENLQELGDQLSNTLFEKLKKDVSYEKLGLSGFIDIRKLL